MKKDFMNSMLIAVFFVVALQFGFAQAPRQIPAFSFKETFSNNIVSQNQLPSSGYIIFDFYDPGCGHCQKMAVGISKNLSQFKNVQFYFVSMNDKEYVEGFINKYAKNLFSAKNVKFLIDTNYEFYKNFKPKEYPSLYVYDAKTKTLIKHFDGEDDINKLLSIIK